MTSAAIIGGPFVINGTNLDSGISEEAGSIRRHLYEPQDRSVSFFLDGRRQDLLDALDAAFQSAAAPNWDNQGALPADALSYLYAKDFLLALPSWVSQPDVNVDPDGEISIDWDRGPRFSFSVSVGRDGTLTYAGLYGSRKNHGVEPFTDALPDVIATNIRRFAEPSN